MANYFLTSGETRGVEPANGKTFELHELQKLVGGYIEIVKLSADTIMVVNEEGLLHNLQPNDNAIWVCAEFGQPRYIVGDVVVCDSNMVE